MLLGGLHVKYLKWYLAQSMLGKYLMLLLLLLLLVVLLLLLLVFGVSGVTHKSM